MSEVKDHSNFIHGYLTWCFLLGIFVIPITMAITTTDTVQKMTDWTSGYSMILGFIIGILLTFVAAFFMEKVSR